MKVDFKIVLTVLLLLLIACTNSTLPENSRYESSHEFSNLKIETSGTITKKDSLFIDSIELRAGDIRYLFPDSSLELLARVFTIRKNKGYINRLENALVIKALTLVEKGNYDSAHKVLDQCLPLIKDERTKAIWHLNKGVIFSHTNDYKQQLSHYMSALDCLDEKGNAQDILYTTAYLNIGIFWNKIGDQERRNIYINKAIETVSTDRENTAKNNFNKQDALSSFYNIQASIFIDERNFVLAKKYLDSNFALIEKVPLLQKRKKEANLLLIMLHLESGDYNKAEDRLKLYQRQLKDWNSPTADENLNQILSEVNFNKENYKLADSYANRIIATTISSKSAYSSKDIRAWEIKAKSLSYLGENYDAVKAYQTLLNIIDSNINSEKLNMARKMDFMYQVGTKDKEIIEGKLLLAERNKQLNKFRVIIFLSVTALLVTSLLVYAYRNRQQLQKKAYLLQHRDSELKYIKDVVEVAELQRRKIGAELHDGSGGTLAAIKMQLNALKRNFPDLKGSILFSDTEQMVDKATEEIRNTSHNLLPEILLKNGLDQAVISYIDQMKNSCDLEIQFNSNLQFGKLRKDVNLTLFRIIQELVQNIVKHADASSATVQLFELKENVNLIVEDDGKGFDVHMPVAGLGIYNVNSRVALLEGSIDWQSHPGMFTVVRITFQKSKLI